MRISYFMQISEEFLWFVIVSLGVQPTRDYANSMELDVDGLPHPGAVIWPGKPYYSTVDYSVGKHKTKRMKGQEIAVVDSVRHRFSPKSCSIGNYLVL